MDLIRMLFFEVWGPRPLLRLAIVAVIVLAIVALMDCAKAGGGIVP